MSRPELLVMVDIETLDTGPRSIVTQLGFVAASIDDPETFIHKHHSFLPIPPQQTLNRTIGAQTLAWWFDQPEEARKYIRESLDDEFEILPSLLRAFNRKLDDVVEGRSFEVWAKGPQFDIVNIESLMADCAVEPFWRYNQVRDLRTLMMLAGVHTADVPRPPEWTEHVADQDCKYQFLCYAAAITKLHTRT